MYIQSLYLEKKNEREEGEEEFEIKKIELMGSGSGASTTAQKHTHGHTRLDNTDTPGCSTGEQETLHGFVGPLGGKRAAHSSVSALAHP